MLWNSVQSLSAHSEQFSSHRVFFDAHAHLHPDFVDWVDETIMWGFVHAKNWDYEDYILSLEQLLETHQEYLRSANIRLSQLEQTIKEYDIETLILEITENNLEQILPTLSTIESIVNLVCKNSQWSRQEQLKKDLMLLYTSAGIYLHYKNLLPKTRLISGEDTQIFEQADNFRNQAKNKRREFIELAKNTKKLLPQDIKTVDTFIADHLDLNNWQEMQAQKENVLSSFSFDDELYRKWEEWIDTHINFLKNSAQRDQHLANLINNLEWNVVVSYGASHAKWLAKNLQLLNPNIETEILNKRYHQNLSDELYEFLTKTEENPRKKDHNTQYTSTTFKTTLWTSQESFVKYRNDNKDRELSVDTLIRLYHQFWGKENLMKKYSFSNQSEDLEKQLKNVYRSAIEKMVTAIVQKKNFEKEKRDIQRKREEGSLSWIGENVLSPSFKWFSLENIVEYWQKNKQKNLGFWALQTIYMRLWGKGDFRNELKSKWEIRSLYRREIDKLIDEI